MANLYIIATPIGNLSDITFRAVDTLKAVRVIACEDTRVTKVLLAHYQIKTPTMSYHQHSAQRTIDKIIQYLSDGADVAVVTDAGTPGISDPGNLLVAAVTAKLGTDCQIVPIPGAAACIAALSVAGLPTDRFTFLGFIPHKKGRQTFYRELAESEYTTVCYESTHRIIKALTEMQEHLTDRPIVVCRELTKKFETVYRGSASEVLAQINATTHKGEFVVVIAGRNYHY